MLAPAFCSLALLSPAWSQTGKTALATVDGQSIYESDLTEAAAQLWQLRNQEYQLKSAALENAVNKRLLEAEATKKGITPEKLVEQEVDAKLGEPSDPELEAFYFGQRDRFGNRPYAELKEQLRPALKQTKMQ